MKRRTRDRVHIATKVAGPSGQMTWIRGGPERLDGAAIIKAAEGSLERLGTDYIDLLYLHWPDRYVPMFGEARFDPARDYRACPLEEQLAAMQTLVEQGKIRAAGLSNETAYGLTLAGLLARQGPGKYAPVGAVQNAYHLLCRGFEEGCAEVCHRLGMRLHAYSPLAMGLLTGKYLGGGRALDRLNRFKGRYAEATSRYGPKPNRDAAIRAYVALARALNIPPYGLALRFVLSHSLVETAVIGAMDGTQLAELAAAAAEGPLEGHVLDKIDEIHEKFPNPTP